MENHIMPFEEFTDDEPPKYSQPKHYGDSPKRNQPTAFGIGFWVAMGVICALVVVGILAAVVGAIGSAPTGNRIR